MLDFWLGPYQQLKLTYATDPQLRWERSSGGSVTALLTALLNGKVIDKVVALCENEKSPIPKFKALTQIAPSLLKTSFYVEPEADLPIEELDGPRTAFVGVHTQIRTVKQMCEKMNVRPPIFIGLDALKVYLQRIGIKLEDVKSVAFRGHGLYGYFTVKTDERVVAFDRGPGAMTREKRLEQQIFYWPFIHRECVTAPDMTAEEADISFGDAWISRVVSTRKVGTNVCIVRTERGLSVINYAIERGYLASEDVEYEEVIESQGNALIGRKLGLWGYPNLAAVPRKGIFGSQVRYLSTDYVPTLTEIWRRRILWELARIRYAQMYIPEIDGVLRFILQQFNRARAIVRRRIVEREIHRRT